MRQEGDAMDVFRTLNVRWVISLVVFLVLLALPVVLSLFAPGSAFAAH
jgi:hypothetical protein